MLTFRRALIAAAFLLTCLYFLSHSQSQDAAIPTIYENTAEGTTPAPADIDKDKEKLIEGEGSGKKDAELVQGKVPARPARTQQMDQQQLQALSNAPLTEKLAYQFPYDLETKFPAYIWQTWKYTPASGDFGENFRPSEASWTENHPGFIHEVITDQVAVHLMRHLYAAVPEVLEAYNSLPLPVLKADFFRYLILLARGGIYTDIDTYSLRSAAEWIPEHVPREAIGLVVGIEADPDRPDWHEWYSRRIQFCQWTIQAKAGHPVLREIVAFITQETLARKANGTLTADQKNVVEYTGPAIWTDKIFDYFNDPRYFDMSKSSTNITWRDFTGMTSPKKVGDVVVLPITSFSPGVGHSGAGDFDDPLAFVKHDFEGTWKPENERHIGE